MNRQGRQFAADSYCWVRVDWPVSSLKGRDSADSFSFLPLRFFGLGIGLMNSANRRSSMICALVSMLSVGCALGLAAFGIVRN